MVMTRTTFELVAEQMEENEAPHSIAEGLGQMTLILHRLTRELALPTRGQDAEAVLDQLVELATVALSLGDAHVLPEIDQKVDE